MTIEKKRIVITGGARFIGSTLAGRLADRNDIVLFDNLARNTLQHTSLSGHRNITFIQGASWISRRPAGLWKGRRSLYSGSDRRN